VRIVLERVVNWGIEAAFEDCQAGRCSCPTHEYEKLASMDVEEAGNVILIRLQTKPREKIDTSEIAACLDYTTANLPDPSSD
jgi:hypothetical protein